MSTYDPGLHRKQMCIGWNEVAKDYKTITVPFLAQYVPRLIEFADLQPGQMVLDVGTGTGLAAIEAAPLVSPNGRVLATDLSDKMISIARKQIDKQGIINIDVHAMPAEKLESETETFDRVISNFGLSFFQEPQKALAEMNRVLKKGGKLTLSTWTVQKRCLVLGIMDSVLKNCFPSLGESKAPSIFDFGTEALLKKALEEAGFDDVRIITELQSARYKKAEDYWNKLYKTGPELRAALSTLKPEQVEYIKVRVVEEVEKYRKGDKIILPSEALIATAIK